MIPSKNYLIPCLIITCWSVACKKGNNSVPQLASIRVTTSGVNTAVILNRITSNGGSVPALVGTCWSSTNPIPSLENCAGYTTNHPDLNGAFTDTLKGLSYNTRYYVRAYGANENGTGYSPVDSFTTLGTQYPPGKAAFGGAVLMVDSTGEHGLVVAFPQYVTTLPWSNDYEFLDGTSTSFGTGQSNTERILYTLSDTAGSAALYCKNLIAEGYHDWFLPSYDEMNYFRSNMTFLQWLNYPWNLYWTSSENGYNEAYFVVLGGNADFHTYDKEIALSVLPMRRF